MQYSGIITPPPLQKKGLNYYSTTNAYAQNYTEVVLYTIYTYINVKIVIVVT